MPPDTVYNELQDSTAQHSTAQRSTDGRSRGLDKHDLAFGLHWPVIGLAGPLAPPSSFSGS